MSIKCEYCGKVKAEDTFFIGATNIPDWCMIEGTGKIACPDCYEVASAEGQSRIRGHVRAINREHSSPTK